MSRAVSTLILSLLIFSYLAVAAASQEVHLPLDQILEKAEAGDTYYQALAGERYRIGDYGEHNPAEALKWLLRANEGGSPVGKYGLGMHYLRAEGADQDSAMGLKLVEEAIPELRKQSEAGNTLAQLTLADAYHDGIGVPQDYAEAKIWYARAVKSGTPRAQNALGVMYINGEGTEPYPETATLWFRRASLQDYPAAMYNYAVSYETGNGVKQIWKYAIEWYQKAADAGYTRAQSRFGYLYMIGHGVDQDYEKAKYWLEKAADQGDTRAAFYLGNMYFTGMGVARDFDQAQAWFEKGSVPLNESDLNAVVREGDQIINGYPPPAQSLKITEGACGEMILWTLLHQRGENLTQLQINRDAGAPDRGIHSPELGTLLNEYGFQVDDEMNFSVIAFLAAAFNPINWFNEKIDEAKATLEGRVIPAVKAGKPVILGVKNYPDKHWMWPMDHFILLVGYNAETDELIYNSNNERARIAVSDLLVKNGYSVINRYRYVPYIVIGGKK